MEDAIRVEHLSKMYKLYDKPSDRLKESLGLSKKKRYREHYALRDVSFDIRKGETVGIIGTNGAGKSTILKIITGVLSPTEGEVSVDGRISALLELGAGFHSEYTGRENIYLYGAVLGYSKEFLDEKFDEIVDFSGLGEFIEVPIKNYSSGMKSRLGFSIATIVEPDILILDEVLSVGDKKFRTKSERKIMSMFEKGVTVLFVSHSLEQVCRLCDKAIILDSGVLVAKGPVDKVARIYKNMTE